MHLSGLSLDARLVLKHGRFFLFVTPRLWADIDLLRRSC